MSKGLQSQHNSSSKTAYLLFQFTAVYTGEERSRSTHLDTILKGMLPKLYRETCKTICETISEEITPRFDSDLNIFCI